MTTLKKLPINDEGKLVSFEANGKVYIIEGSLSFERLEKYEQLEVELGLGLRLQTVLEKLDEQKVCYDEGRHADAVIVNHELRSGAYHKMDNKTNSAFEMCALFMNTEDEDRRYISRELIKTKIEDWKIEGYAVNDFFQFAISSIPGYISAYGKNFQNTSSFQEK